MNVFKLYLSIILGKSESGFQIPASDLQTLAICPQIPAGDPGPLELYKNSHRTKIGAILTATNPPALCTPKVYVQCSFIDVGSEVCKIIIMR